MRTSLRTSYYSKTRMSLMRMNSLSLNSMNTMMTTMTPKNCWKKNRNCSNLSLTSYFVKMMTNWIVTMNLKMNGLSWNCLIGCCSNSKIG